MYFTGYFEPLPDRADIKGGAFVYYGPEGETVPVATADAQTISQAEAVLGDTDYFGAFATGPGGQSGSWTGARTAALAGQYAVAACGQGCSVVAERLPANRDPDRFEPALTTQMVQYLMLQWPFNRDYLAIGGANAWGFGNNPAGSGRSALRRAVEECEVRRATEDTPDGITSAPCKITSLDEIELLRPKPELYPAPFTLALTALSPVAEFSPVRTPETADNRAYKAPRVFRPNELHGALATNGETATEYLDGAGWPEAGQAIAMLKCEASRRPGEPPCVISYIGTATTQVPAGTLGVEEDLYNAYTIWQNTSGAGAFAISPYGAWGTSQNYDDIDAAIQNAADWCWYYTRRNWEFRQVDRAALDVDIPCRIVAIREP